MYAGPGKDVLTLFVEPTPSLWVADPIDDGIAVFRVLDEHGEETGEIAGVEIIDFLTFDRWEDLPDLPMKWQLDGLEPLPLRELLRKIQQTVRREKVAAG